VRVPFTLVDVFTDRPLAGNQLCVVTDPPQGLTTQTMQLLAREIGYSETTFVTRAAGDRYSMRIFTPDAELPFAGHPTLGTAFVLVERGRVGTSPTQEVAAGEIPVEVDLPGGRARMRQLDPEFGEEFDDRAILAAAIGLSVRDLHPELAAQVISTGLSSLLVPLRDAETLRRAERDARSVRVACERSGAESFYPFAISDAGVWARMFDPGEGIGEDPATGSAAGPLGAYLAARGLAGMPGTMLVHQGEQVGRPSRLEVQVRQEGGGWLVHVGGGVRIVGEGAFELA
jgi:trans-2,3-dihydro-3-hydroxyanthranilate isomerase